jgi:membrane-associated phospholipid phosphatase
MAASVDTIAAGGVVDQAIVDWFAAHRSSAVVSVARAVTYLGSSTAAVVSVALIGFLVTRSRRDLRQSLAVAATLVLGALAARQVTAGLKVFIERPRPQWPATTVGGYSFPSGHATAAGFVAVVAGSLLPGRWRWLSIPFAVAIPLTRLVLGVHYLSDVAAGLAVGAALAIVSVLMARRVTNR